MPRFESMAARMAAAPLGTWCRARISYCMQCSIAWHGMPRFRINGCAHGSRIAWLVILASNQWLRAWRQHRLAHGASLESVATCNAVSLGTGCLASKSMASITQLTPTKAWLEAPSAPAWTGLDTGACKRAGLTYTHSWTPRCGILVCNTATHMTAALRGS